MSWTRYDIGAAELAEQHLQEARDAIGTYRRRAEHDHEPALLDAARTAYTRAFRVLWRAGFIDLWGEYR